MPSGATVPNLSRRESRGTRTLENQSWPLSTPFKPCLGPMSCMCVCVRVCVCACVCTYGLLIPFPYGQATEPLLRRHSTFGVYIHVYMYTCMYMCAWMFVCVCECMRVCTYLCKRVFVWVFVCQLHALTNKAKAPSTADALILYLDCQSCRLHLFLTPTLMRTPCMGLS